MDSRKEETPENIFESIMQRWQVPSEEVETTRIPIPEELEEVIYVDQIYPQELPPKLPNPEFTAWFSEEINRVHRRCRFLIALNTILCLCTTLAIFACVYIYLIVK
jgi:hypothetical protein